MGNLIKLEHFRNPLFLLGIVLRIFILYLSSPIIVETLYVPFLQTSINTFTLNPWENWIESGGSKTAFPYGYVMWVIFLVPTLIAKLLDISVLIFYWFTIFIFDLLFLYFLGFLFKINQNKLLFIYWLSPIVIVTTYLLGYNDLIPITIFTLALITIKLRKIKLSSIFLMAAISAKLSMVLALPFVILYFVNNKSYKPHLLNFLKWLLISFSIFHIPQFFFGYEASQMILTNQEMSKIFDLVILLPNQSEIFIVPIIFLFLFFYCFTIKRINFEIFIVIQGLAFFITVLLVPSSLGWFLWALPLIIYYQRDAKILRILLVILFSLLFVIHSLINSLQFNIQNLNFDSTKLILYDNYLDLASIIYTGMFTTGVLLSFHIWQSTMKKNLPYQFAGRSLAIGIAGDSGSGKDTLASALTNLFGSHSVVSLSGDNYHLWDRDKKMWSLITHLNPKANNLSLFLSDLMQLIKGNTISIRHYNHKDGKKSRITKLKSNDVIISSGLHALFLPSIRECYDLKIFLDMDDELRRFFKTQRDVKIRGHSIEKVNKTFLQRKNDSKKYISWQKDHADLIFSLKPIKKINFKNLDENSKFPLSIVIYSPDGFDEYKFVRGLIGFLGAKIDTSSKANSSGIELTIEADPSERDIELFAKKVCSQILDILDIEPKWQNGMTGIMQLVTLLKIEYVINKRLIL